MHAVRYVPRAGLTAAKEIAHIEDFMRKHRKAYNADEKLQKRYRDLLALREQQTALGQFQTAGRITKNLGSVTEPE